jgi:hypothetical protein
MADAVAEARRRLLEIAGAAADKGFALDQALSTVEDGLVEAASRALGAPILIGLDQASRDATAAYKSRMPAKVYETLIGESVRRKILQHFGLPRVLLAEIE